MCSYRLDAAQEAVFRIIKTVDNLAIDPVCGMQVDPEKAAARSEFEGKTYYFCCAGCKKKFEGNAMPVATSGAAEYTCPMHPEVRQKRPGACPKCGMALEPLEVTGAEANPELAEMERRFWVSAALTIPLLILMFWAMSHMTCFIHLALATPFVLWGVCPFFELG